MIREDEHTIALVGGTGRSGTTLLSEMLATHPDIASVPELRFLVDPDGILDYYSGSKTSWSPYLADLRLTRLLDLLNDVKAAQHPSVRKIFKAFESGLGLQLSPRYQSVGVGKFCPDFESHVEALEESLTKFKYDAKWSGKRPFLKDEFRYVSPDSEVIRQALIVFLNDVYTSILRTQDKLVYLEKNTWNICWFHHMLDLFPSSRLVHIVRDPRAVAVSFMRQSWMPSDLQRCAQIITDLHSAWTKNSEKISNDRYITVRFEDLLREPATTLKQVFKFYAIRIPEHLSLPELNLEADNAWKERVSPQELSWLNAHFSPILHRYGYE